MTKKLEETFEMDSDDINELLDSAKDLKKQTKNEISEILSSDQIEKHEEQLDQYADTSFNYAREAADLALGCEPRHASELFNAAASLLKTALDAQNSKIEKRTKLLELEMKKRKLDHEINGSTSDYDNSGEFLSREDILGKKDK